MSNILFDLSGKIDQQTVDALSLVNSIADSLSIPFFVVVMHKYEEAGNFDRLYNSEQDLLQEEKFDTRHASIRLLGRDMAKIADAETLIVVRSILDSETREQSQYRLVRDMIKGSLSYDERFEAILVQAEKLKKGLSEVAGKP